MTSLTTHNFIGLDTTFPVRIVELNGQPWFVGSDVLKVLYGRSAGLANIYTRLADDEVTKVNRINLGEAPGRPMALVSESGLYKLVMRSDKPQARLFQDWVTRDVLPAIRKDGAYVMGEEKVASGEMDEDEFVLKAMAILQKKVERLKEEKAVLQHRVDHLTVREYEREMRLYMQPGTKQRFSRIAGDYCRAKKLEIGKTPMKLISGGELIEREINVYPREALEHAALLLRLA